jgi:RNA polymerase sigma factor (sigma-70 family)
LELPDLVDLHRLISRFVNRSDEAQRRFRALYDRNYRPVFGYVMRRADNRATAEETVSETFLVAWRRLEAVPDGDGTLPWLLAVARRVLSNAHRGDVRRERLVSKIRHDRPEPPLGSDDPGDVRLRQRAVAVALARIRPGDAEVLQLVFWERLSHAQIAVVLDCSVNAVGIRVHRARRNLLSEIQKGSSDSGHSLVTGFAPTNPQ